MSERHDEEGNPMYIYFNFKSKIQKYVFELI
jgi:hypothetical protein